MDLSKWKDRDEGYLDGPYTSDSIVNQVIRSKYFDQMPPAGTPMEETGGVISILNSYGYRSDEFNKEEAQDNFLFSGCSFTWAAGLPEGGGWTHFVNKKLGGQKHFSIAMAGASPSVIIKNVYRYIREFGKPKAVFMLVPNLERFEWYEYVVKEDYKIFAKQYPMLLHTTQFNDRIKTDEQLDFLHTIMDDEYNMITTMSDLKTLEEYLDMMDVPFVWTTWDNWFLKNLRHAKDAYNNFVDMPPMPFEYLRDNMPEPGEEKYWFEAADGPQPHPGIGEQKYFAEYMVKGYMQKFGDKVR